MSQIDLRHNTGGQIVPLGKFLDNTNGDSEETTLTIANTDIKLWKRNSTSIVNKNSGGASHMANGEYYATFDSTDCNTVGPMKISVHVDGALTVQVWAKVWPQNVYDSLILGSDNLDVNLATILNNNPNSVLLDSSDIRNSVGLSSANLDTQISTLATTIQLDSAVAGINITASGLDSAGIRNAVGLSTNNLDTQLGLIATKTELDSAIDSSLGSILSQFSGLSTTIQLDSAKSELLGASYSVNDVDSATATKIADFILRRSLASARASSNGQTVTFRSLLGAISKSVNRILATDSDLVIYAEDDTTPFATQTLTLDSNAVPITGLNTD